MNEQLKEWTEMIESKFGLEGYTCFETVTAYEKNDWNETSYRFSMEWLPPGVSGREEDEYNPKGTAVIEIDAKAGRLNSVIFVGGKAPTNGFSFLTGDKEEVIRFVEQEAGWTYGHQFIDAEPIDADFAFQTAFKGIPLSPEGYINVSLDEQKKLVFFSRFGLVPDAVEEAEFSLAAEKIEALAKERLVFVEYPAVKEEKWLPVYMIDDVLVDHQTGKVLEEEQEILTWKTAKNKKYKRKLVQMAPADIDPDRLFDFPPHPDTKPITKKAYAKICAAATEFLQTRVPRESGDWSLSNVKRANGVIEARVTNRKDIAVIPRIWQLFVDPDSCEMISWHDRSVMLDQFVEYEKAPKPVLSKDEAFDIIKPYITVTPMYAFDGNTYRLHGKLDSAVAVHAVTGDILHL